MNEQTPPIPPKAEVKTASSPNASLVRKSSARMLAVQACFQAGYMEMSARKADVLEHIVPLLMRDVLKEYYDVTLNYDKKLLNSLLHGVLWQWQTLEDQISVHSDGYMEKRRASDFLKAILRVACFELLHSPKLSTRIVLNEYTSIGADFLDEEETRLLNGLLHALAHGVRSESE